MLWLHVLWPSDDEFLYHIGVSTSCFLLTLSKDVFPIHPASGVAFYPILTGRKFVQFTDSSSEVELRLQLGTQDIRSSKDVYVDANETSLTIRVQRLGSIITLLETKQLFEKIKPAETIWFVVVMIDDLLQPVWISMSKYGIFYVEQVY